MPTTSNFGWTTPADTDLVKDGAAAIRTLGNGIDTSFLDLKGGTTDQVLAKNSNSDLDFKWVAQDDSNAIQNAIVDAKGDLISATAADTPARLAVGSNGTVLTADSSEATGLKWATPSAGSLTLISSTALGASVSVSGCFTSTYINYLLLVYITNATSNADVNLRLRAGSTDTTSGYVMRGDISTVSAEFKLLQDSNSAGQAVVQLSGPQIADATLGTFLASGLNIGTAYNGFRSTGALQDATQYDGFTLYSAATLTGTVKVYGYQN